MFSTSPGGAVESSDAPDTPKAARRTHDEAAFIEARARAMSEALALAATIYSADSPTALIASQAREAMRAAGMLWETASRLLDE